MIADLPNNLLSPADDISNTGIDDVLVPDSQVPDLSPPVDQEYYDWHPVIINNTGRTMDLSKHRYTLITDELEPRPLFANKVSHQLPGNRLHISASDLDEFCSDVASLPPDSSTVHLQRW